VKYEVFPNSGEDKDINLPYLLTYKPNFRPKI